MKYLCPKCNQESDTTIDVLRDTLNLGCTACRQSYVIVMMPFDDYLIYLKAMESYTGKSAAERKTEFLAQPDKRTLSNDRDLAEFKQAFFDGKLDKYMGKDK